VKNHCKSGLFLYLATLSVNQIQKFWTWNTWNKVQLEEFFFHQ
jgi:hypothetical protein